MIMEETKKLNSFYDVINVLDDVKAELYKHEETIAKDDYFGKSKNATEIYTLLCIEQLLRGHKTKEEMIKDLKNL